jgi:hypothetical protein
MIGDIFAGHCWLELGDECNDFSPGDWRSLDPVASEHETFGSALGAVQWDITPPEFFWLDRSLVTPVSRQTPPLGQVWLNGWHGHLRHSTREK